MHILVILGLVIMIPICAICGIITILWGIDAIFKFWRGYVWDDAMFSAMGCILTGLTTCIFGVVVMMLWKAL